MEIGGDTSGGRTVGRPEMVCHGRLVVDDDVHGSAEKEGVECREPGIPEERMRFTYDQDYELKEVFLDDKVTL